MFSQQSGSKKMKFAANMSSGVARNSSTPLQPSNVSGRQVAGSANTEQRLEGGGDVAQKQRSVDPNVHRLHRAWRALASSLLVAARAYPSTTKGAQQGQQQRQQQLPQAQVAQQDKAAEEALLTSLRSREELRRVANLLEDHLKGTDGRSREVLEDYVRSEAVVGVKRKRAFDGS